MHADRWAQLETIFFQALDQDPSQRSAFLDETCEDDADLRAEVEAMLDAHEDDAPLHLEEKLVQTKAQPIPMGADIGPYRLIKRIGQGGMGDVFLAERADDQYQQQVALKLVKAGWASGETLLRFRVERQILARLQHPNIARLLDGGLMEGDATAPEGRPYLVMEYIDGVPLNTYCDDHQLSIPDRLRLFETVCRAVHVAHQNLIVHRDLKPSNILVTKGDGTSPEGRVKLLDFGIAKLMDPDEAGEAPLTRTGFQLMTPEYASPEQVRGETITTVSDVYTLGVLLYELLTGHRPYQVRATAPQEWVRIICEQDLPRPSTAVRATQTRTRGEEEKTITPRMVSQARKTSPDKLHNQLSGDLDTIILMALRKDPTRRYTSAEQLAEDINRHLNGRPVLARKDTVRYRVQKFIGRHKLGVSMTVGLFLLISAFGITMAVQANRIARQSEDLAFERDRARIEAEKAQQVTAFLTDLFQGSDPTKSQNASITAREMLDQGAEKVKEELAEQPEVQVELLNVIGGVYRHLGLYPAALEILEDANAIAQADTVRSQAYLENLHEAAKLHYRMEAFAEAETLMQQAMTLYPTVHPNEPEDPGLLNTLAMVTESRGNVTEARRLYHRVIELRRASGIRDMNLAANLNNLAMLLTQDGNLAAADTLFEESHSILLQEVGGNHPYVAFLFGAHAGVYMEQGRYPEAETKLMTALQIAQEKLGPDHPFIDVLHSNLTQLYTAWGKPEQAQPFE